MLPLGDDTVNVAVLGEPLDGFVLAAVTVNEPGAFWLDDGDKKKYGASPPVILFENCIEPGDVLTLRVRVVNPLPLNGIGFVPSIVNVVTGGGGGGGGGGGVAGGGGVLV